MEMGPGLPGQNAPTVVKRAMKLRNVSQNMEAWKNKPHNGG
jgi:hypothetical protein